MIQFKKASKEEKDAVRRIGIAAHKWVGAWSDKDSCWIVLNGSQIVATVREKFHPGKGFFRGNEKWIFNVWVRKNWRGKKLGQQLMSFYLEDAKPDTVFLDCKPSLEKYYNVLGFVEKIEPTLEEREHFELGDNVVLKYKT